MRCCECFVLLLLIAFTTGREYRKSFNELQDEMESRRRQDDLYTEFKRRLLLLLGNSDSLSAYSQESMYDSSDMDTPPDYSSSTSSTTTTFVIRGPVRVAVFNSGSYSVRLSLSYTIDNQTVEQQPEGLFIPAGQVRSSFIPRPATNIRIRVVRYGAYVIGYIVDDQIGDANNSSDRCYLLAGTLSHPVYGICPTSYESMLKAWVG